MTQSQSKPTPIEIHDLAAPVLPEMLTDYMAERVAAFDADWSAAELLVKASDATGLKNFNADTDFTKRLQLILDSFIADKDMSDFGRLTNYDILLRYAINRLRIEALIAEYPNISQEPITKPVIIAGLPRSGTTHMLNLVSADKRWRHLPYWESLEPVALVGEDSADRLNDPRRQRCVQALELQDQIIPYFKNMHEMTADHTHEEIELAGFDYSCVLFENYGLVPAWRDYYLAHDQRPHYRYIRRALQALQWQYPQGGIKANPELRWILKSPQHMEQLAVLADTFADAYYILPHRDPIAIVVSLATMMAYTGRMSRSRIRPQDFTNYWADRMETMLKALVAQYTALPKERTVHVHFNDFMANDMQTIKDIYASVQQPMNEEALLQMQDYMTQHPRGRLGRIKYDLKALGVDVVALRARYRFYTDHFEIHEEY